MEGTEEFVLGDAKFLEDLCRAGVGILVESGEEEMFDAEILVLKFLGGLRGAAEEGLEARGDVDTASGGTGTGDLGQAGDFRFEAVGELGGLGAELFQEAGNETVLLGGEGVEEVLDLDGLVALLGGLGRDGLRSIFMPSIRGLTRQIIYVKKNYVS